MFGFLIALAAILIALFKNKSNSGDNSNYGTILNGLKHIAQVQKDMDADLKELKQSNEDGIKKILDDIAIMSARLDHIKTGAIPDAIAEDVVMQEPDQEAIIEVPIEHAPKIIATPEISIIPEHFEVDGAPEENLPHEEEEVLYLSDRHTKNIHPTSNEVEEEPIPEALSQKEAPIAKDLEKFIGENIINKIGIAILVLGVAFFVKYAIDQNWINEVGRVCIGLLSGVILSGFAHALRKNYRPFSSVLAGGGIAVYYFTIAFAYHQYHLLPQTGAFAVMVVITIFAILLAILYDRLELAIIAAIGGFLTPFMVSNGSGNYQVLFTYLMILNAGMLALGYFKKWPPINVIALAFTQIIFCGWLANLSSKEASLPVAFGFDSAFYVMFLSMNMVHQLRKQNSFSAFDLSILLFISAIYNATGLILLDKFNQYDAAGLFTALFGLVNLCLAYIIYRTQKPDKNLFYLFIGITLTLVSLTIPIQLHGQFITMFWSVEFVLLYWLFIKSGIRLYKAYSLIICMLSLLSLIKGWGQVYSSYQELPLIYKDIKGIVTNLVAVASFSVFAYLVWSKKNEFILEIPVRTVARMSLLIATAILYVTCTMGVNLYFTSIIGKFQLANEYHRIITYVFAIGTIIVLRRTKDVAIWWQLVPFAICVFYLFGSYTVMNKMVDYVLTGTIASMHMVSHWLGALVFALLLWLTAKTILMNQDKLGDKLNVLIVLFSVTCMLFLGSEGGHMFVLLVSSKLNIPEVRANYNRAGLTVIWGLSSFALMWLGMKHDYKMLRLLSLVTFGIVLLKLFVIDISNISEGGKILAFILLGILLLIVSFMYQKLKKILIGNPQNNEEEA